jgi:hypothetical protein
VKGYRVTVRAGPRVERARYEDARQAMAAVERHGRDLEAEAATRPVGGRIMRRLEPVQQVVGRIEVTGPGRFRGGVDIRGDGSSEAFTGRLRRTLLKQRDGESSYQALRRALAL